MLPKYTLWDAAKVKGHHTMWSWWKWIRKRTLGKGQTKGITTKDVDISPPQVATDILSTFSVGLKPTSHQKKVLDEMIRVTNHTYNWCNWLCANDKVKPKQFDLQKIVTKTHVKDVPQEMRIDTLDDDWFFKKINWKRR